MKDVIFDEPKPISLRDGLELLRSSEWIYQEVPSVPLFGWLTGRAYTYGLYEAGFSPKGLFTGIHNEIGAWVIDRKQLVKLAKRLVDAELKGKSIVDRWISDWKKVDKQYHRLVTAIRKTDIKKLNDENFLTLFKQFSRLLYEEETLPLCNEFFIPYSDQVLSQVARKHPDWAEAIAERAVPRKKSFLQQEEDELRWISKLKRSKQSAALKHHTEKWFFINASYSGYRPVTAGELRRRMAELSTKPKRRLLQRHHEQPRFDRKTGVVLKLSQKIGEWKDERKRNNSIGFCILELFGREYARRSQVSWTLIRQAVPRELPKLLEDPSDLVPLLRDRERYGMVWVQLEEQETIFTRGNFAKLWEALQKVRKPKTRELSGMIASSGKVSGTVRIVNHPGRDQFNEGEILLTSMTRPEFVPLMKRAAAVLCDEGGLLSHAAIVSRELGIPCIVGLKHAMVSLKSGGRIEVDATKGIVRKL